jgi:hypothetical protein
MSRRESLYLANTVRGLLQRSRRISVRCRSSGSGPQRGPRHLSEVLSRQTRCPNLRTTPSALCEAQQGLSGRRRGMLSASPDNMKGLQFTRFGGQPMSHRRSLRDAEVTSTESAKRKPPAGYERRQCAVPALRQHGSAAHPPATARSAAELGAPGLSLSLREAWLRVGRQPPTEMVRQRSVPPPPLRWMGQGHWPLALSSSVCLSCARTPKSSPRLYRTWSIKGTRSKFRMGSTSARRLPPATILPPRHPPRRRAMSGRLHQSRGSGRDTAASSPPNRNRRLSLSGGNAGLGI